MLSSTPRDDKPEMQVFLRRLWTRRIYVIGGISMLIIGSAVLVGIGTTRVTSVNETFRFITLLVMFMAALATTAAVFVGLRMGNSNEAFGLPSGSVRALLAIGIMILFVVFGLPLVTPEPLRTIPLNRVVTVAPENLTRFLDQSRASGVQFAVLDVGRTATPPAIGGGPATPAVNASVLLLEATVPARTAEELDFGKQLITAIITLLTTVIGFYFGSRSTSDAIREAETQVGNTASTELNVLRKGLEEKFAPLRNDIIAKAQLLAGQRDMPAPEDEAQAAEREAALERAEVSRGDVERQRDEVARLLTAADEALKAMMSATQSDVRQVHERNARDSLQGAGEQLTALQQAFQGLAADIDTLISANAAG